MPGIDIIKDWQSLKKQGLPALIVALVWAITELVGVFEPKDPSCQQEVKFLQSEVSIAYQQIRERDKMIISLDSANNKKYMIIHTIDSVYRVKVVNPAKPVIENQKHHDQ